MIAVRHAVLTTAALTAGLTAGLSLGACSSDSSNSKPAPSVASSGTGTAGASASGASSSSSSPSPAGSTSSSSAATMTPDEATSTLKQKAATAAVSTVRVGSGYEGASADASTMHFWHTDATGAWVKDGDVPRIQSFSSSVSEKITGKMIRGAAHAVFILDAGLGGDGAAPTAQAYARSSAGWGGIAPTNDDGSTIAVTSNPGERGGWHTAGFDHDKLTLASFVPGTSNANGHDVTRAWVMNGDAFTLISTDDPAQKAQDFTATEGGRFTSPSGKNRCDIAPGLVTCELSPTAAAANGGSKLISLNSYGWAFVAGSSGLTGDGSDAWATTGSGIVPDAINGTRILPYGSTIKAGDVTCRSSANGFECSNSTASFTVNSQGATTTGHHNDDLAAAD